jgi:hypothetical protein
MNCKEISAIIKRGGSRLEVSFGSDAASVMAHISECPKCKNLLLLERLVPALINAGSAPELRSDAFRVTPSLIYKVRARAQELGEQHGGSLVSAIEAAGGWLAAFAAAAIILFVVSVHWRSSDVVAGPERDGVELITQTPSDNEIPDLGAVGKDIPHAHK